MNEAVRLNPFEAILERQVDDAAFLWVLRTVAVYQPQYGLAELQKLESRIEKHIDGLMLSPEDAWRYCEAASQLEEPGEAFVSAMFAFRLMDVDKIRQATDFGFACPETFKAITSALAWLPANYSMPWLKKFLKSKDLNHKHLAIAVSSIQRLDPGDYLQNIFTREDCLNHKELYMRALRIVGELKRSDLMPALNQAMNHEDPDIVFWAHWSAILLGNRSVAPMLKPVVMEEGPYQQKAIEMAFRVLEPTVARQWIGELSQKEDAIRQVIKASAILGDPQVVSWLIEKMKQPVLARLAGEAFVAITGIDLERYELCYEVPDLSDEKTIADADFDEFSLEDENLAWPSCEKVAAVWQKYGNSFTPGQRYFWGQPSTPELLYSVLKKGGQRERHAAALTLALDNRGEIYVNTEATIKGAIAHVD